MPKLVKKKSVTSVLKSKGIKKPKPIWKGPEVDGVTQSLLSLFLVCRERFRIKVVDGLVGADKFKAAMEYGNMFHLCEELYMQRKDWKLPLKKMTQDLIKQYKSEQEQVVKYYEICLRQFPIYMDHWKKSEKQNKLKPISSEIVFKVPYELPSGRIVSLRGKFDGLECAVNGKIKHLFLKENKIMGTPDHQELAQRLTFDLQTMVYLVALRIYAEQTDNSLLKYDLKGVNFNVIRRPLAGGKHSIRQHQPSKSKPKGESEQEYYDRLGGLIDGDREFFFMRWNVAIEEKDIRTFETKFLQPVLENLCDWWEDINQRDPFKPFGKGNRTHWVLPYGIYNPIAEGRGSMVDDYIKDGNMVGLVKTKTLFPELA